MGNMVRVGMADMNICQAPDAITTLGLGSCVGVVLYDSVTKISGMVHVMLPDSKRVVNNDNRAKFADTGIEDMLEMLARRGVSRIRLKAKIAGGAQMFAVGSNNELMRVGQRNVEAVKAELAKLRISIVAEDTGKNYGRTIEFYPETEELLIKAVGRAAYKI